MLLGRTCFVKLGWGTIKRFRSVGSAPPGGTCLIEAVSIVVMAVSAWLVVAGSLSWLRLATLILCFVLLALFIPTARMTRDAGAALAFRRSASDCADDRAIPLRTASILHVLLDFLAHDRHCNQKLPASDWFACTMGISRYGCLRGGTSHVTQPLRSRARLLRISINMFLPSSKK